MDQSCILVLILCWSCVLFDWCFVQKYHKLGWHSRTKAPRGRMTPCQTPRRSSALESPNWFHHNTEPETETLNMILNQTLRFPQVKNKFLCLISCLFLHPWSYKSSHWSVQVAVMAFRVGSTERSAGWTCQDDDLSETPGARHWHVAESEWKAPASEGSWGHNLASV